MADISRHPGHPPVPELSAAMSECLAQNWWLVALRGVCAIVLGVIAFVMPAVTIATLVLLFAAYMMADGILAVISAVRAMGRRERWLLLVLEGLADIAAGIIAFIWPGITVLAVLALMAAWAIVSGGLMVAAMFRLRQTHGRWLLGLGGVISIVWGVLLVIAPVAGALVLTWWFGGYAVAFGITMLVLGYRLRQRRGELRRDFSGAAAAAR